MMKKAFTLIELLVVMAITAVMLTLIVLPIFQSFQILRTAQAFADAQDKARLLTERIAREIGNAVSVRNASDTVAIIGGNPYTLPYTKLDLVPPATGAPEAGLGNGVFRDPITGKIDPTLTRPKGDINLNVVPGATIVRWFVGLNRPFNADGTQAQYNEPYTGLLMARSGNQDNLYVLRRAEVQPFVYRPRKDGAANSSAWRPNLKYFHSDDKITNTQEFDTRIIDLDDPYFFIPDGKYLRESDSTRVADPTNNGIPGKNDRVANWAKASVVQTEISRYDMIRPALTGSPPQLDQNAAVKVIPLIQFRPTRVASEPASGSAAARPGEAVEGIDRIGPDTYKTERGLWANAIVRYYPGGYSPGNVGAANAGLEVANVDPYGAVAIEAGQFSAGGLDTGAAFPNNYQMFDSKAYEQYLSRGQAYPFTAAASNAGATDTTPGRPGTPWYNVDAQRQLFTPFRVLTATGKIVTSFPIDEVGVNAIPVGDVNLPYVTVKTNLTPQLDTAGSRILSPLTPNATEKGRNPNYDPNHAFNYAWNTYPELQGVLQRFIDLRMLANEDSTLSPLNPFPPSQTSAITGFSFPNAQGGETNRVRIVPGSDEVYGPDQNLGSSNYGNTVRYTRVTGNPGPNQYRLVYADLAEPTNGAGQVDYSILGFSNAVMTDGGAFSPTSYQADNVVAAMIQPRFKAGYLQLDSDPSVPIPLGSITVKYRFQLTGPSDTFAVDLDTREIMQILLTIKNYPQSNTPNAQTVTLKSTATLRNALR